MRSLRVRLTHCVVSRVRLLIGVVGVTCLMLRVWRIRRGGLRRLRGRLSRRLTSDIWRLALCGCISCFWDSWVRRHCVCSGCLLLSARLVTGTWRRDWSTCARVLGCIVASIRWIFTYVETCSCATGDNKVVIDTEKILGSFTWEGWVLLHDDLIVI